MSNNGELEDKPPAPPVRVSSTSFCMSNKDTLLTNHNAKPLPSVPEEKQKRTKLKSIFSNTGEKGRVRCQNMTMEHAETGVRMVWRTWCDFCVPCGDVPIKYWTFGDWMWIGAKAKVMEGLCGSGSICGENWWMIFLIETFLTDGSWSKMSSVHRCEVYKGQKV